MIPFRNSLPYDIVMKDVYVPECPFCGQTHVLLPIKPDEVRDLRGSVRKRAVVFPCCHTRLQLVDADGDYLLADRPLNRK
ncbi:hypothetical protein E5161_17945 [Cohnella pontilimi]|uniref:Uncharacterized protein n=1 Tax=Cohnella pontilimi TaxID=2564100 RepID=A0A4U0F5D2_9BACL|nr:hypothetical protein [Cohnella pontilimi]TJY39825.1 hypothetical protein E5161_17945 [Cohnella pontilimi]